MTPSDDDEKPKAPSADEIRAQLQSSNETFRKCGELFEANQQELSKLLHQRYKSLLAAGFNEAQAFTLIVQRGLG